MAGMTERMDVDQFRRQMGTMPAKTHSKPAVKASARKRLEDAFFAAFALVKPQGVPMPDREHRFHDSRKWRFDLAWPSIKLAVEIQGGSFVNGGHNRGAQQAKDYEKLNEAQRHGWIVLQFGTMQMKDVAGCVDVVLDVMVAIGQKL